MLNNIILFLQVGLISLITLIALRIGEKAVNAWLCVLAIGMNLLVLKQIRLFGLDVTATDSLAVGYIIGLNLLQEYFGKKSARVHVGIAFLCALGFTLVSHLHLKTIPNIYDDMHHHYEAILSPLPRLLVASFVSFIGVQSLDITFFSFLRKKFRKRFLPIRIFFSLMLSQALDTLIFSFLGLYGLIENITHVILLSLGIKFIIIIFSVPYTIFSPIKKEEDFVKS